MVAVLRSVLSSAAHMRPASCGSVSDLPKTFRWLTRQLPASAATNSSVREVSHPIRSRPALTLAGWKVLGAALTGLVAPRQQFPGASLSPTCAHSSPETRWGWGFLPSRCSHQVLDRPGRCPILRLIEARSVQFVLTPRGQACLAPVLAVPLLPGGSQKLRAHCRPERRGGGHPVPAPGQAAGHLGVRWAMRTGLLLAASLGAVTGPEKACACASSPKGGLRTVSPHRHPAEGKGGPMHCLGGSIPPPAHSRALAPWRACSRRHAPSLPSASPQGLVPPASLRPCPWGILVTSGSRRQDLGPGLLRKQSY